MTRQATLFVQIAARGVSVMSMKLKPADTGSQTSQSPRIARLPALAFIAAALRHTVICYQMADSTARLFINRPPAVSPFPCSLPCTTIHLLFHEADICMVDADTTLRASVSLMQ